MLRITQVNGRKLGTKVAGRLRQGRGFALCAQGPELDASGCTRVSLRSAVTARDKASYHASPHQAWKNNRDTHTHTHTHTHCLHSFSRLVGCREEGESWTQSQSLLHQIPVLGPQSARASVMYKKTKTPFSLPHSTGEGTEAQRRLKAPRTNRQIQT